MKPICHTLCRAALFVLLCSAASGSPGSAAPAQPATQAPVQSVVAASALPILEAAPQITGVDGLVTLSLPGNFAPLGNKSTPRLALYEHGRPTKIADIKKNFILKNGVWSTQVRLEADPGSYDFRVIADDKTRTPLSQPATVTVAGIVREPGWWLLNGSPFVEFPNKDDAPPPANAPLFVLGLRRDARGKTERRIAVPSNTPVRWRGLYLPSLRDIAATKDYDYARLQSTLAQQIEEARAKGERNYLGFIIRDGFAPTGIFTRIGGTPVVLPPEAREVVRRLRQITTSLQPEAALIFEATLNQSGEATAANLQIAADLCDAVALYPDPSLQRFLGRPLIDGRSIAWAVKAARRIVEEQARYDLPIFLISTWPTSRQEPDSISGSGVHVGRKISTTASATELWMAGASGAVLTSGDNALTELRQLVNRNASLFIGSVTLEDVGLLPLSQSTSLGSLSSSYPAIGGDDDDDDDDSGTLRTVANSTLYSLLTSGGRIPGMALLQQKPDKKAPESFMAILGDSISPETIEKLIVAARGGATIYLEGSPRIEGDSASAAARWSTLVGATTKAVPPKRATMILDDPWLFGTARGSKLLVRQSVEATLNTSAGIPPGGKKDEPEKGRDILAAPRVASRLEDGTPGLIESPVGDGRVLWSPHRAQGFTNRGDSTEAPKFYHAIASQLQAALVQIRPGLTAEVPLFNKKSDEPYSSQPKYFIDPPAVRVALRRSAEGSWLVGLFNTSTQAGPITLEANHFAGVALDLATEKELTFQTRGNRTTLQTTVPANGWQIIALAESRKALDEERFAPRSKARLK